MKNEPNEANDSANLYRIETDSLNLFQSLHKLFSILVAERISSSSFKNVQILDDIIMVKMCGTVNLSSVLLTPNTT